jgi:hypothetical protein
MSTAGQRSAPELRWRQKLESRRRAVRRRLALDRWYPHTPLAVAMAVLGLLYIALASGRALGRGRVAAEVVHLEQQLNPFHHDPVLEVALGISVLAVSIGIGLRSRLAWLWSVAAMIIALSVRFPPRFVDVSSMSASCSSCSSSTGDTS